MKKFAILTIALCLSAIVLVGCGCMNTNADVTTLPTNGEMTKPTTAPSTQPSTAPSTAATTEPATMPSTGASETPSESTGPLEGAMDDIMGGSTDDATLPGGSGDNGGATRSRAASHPEDKKIRVS